MNTFLCPECNSDQIEEKVVAYRDMNTGDYAGDTYFPPNEEWFCRECLKEVGRPILAE